MSDAILDYAALEDSAAAVETPAAVEVPAAEVDGEVPPVEGETPPVEGTETETTNADGFQFTGTVAQSRAAETAIDRRF